MASTRRIILPISGWAVHTAGAFINSGQNRFFQMDDTVQSFIVNNFMMPYDWNGGNFTVYVRVLEGGTTGNAYMTLLMDVWKANEASSNIVNSAQALALSNSGTAHKETSFTVTGSNVEQSDTIGIRVGRLGDNVLDTYTGNSCYITTVYVEYTTRDVTTTFSANTKIKSAEINQNFQDVR